jgi:tRNA (cmo5U34)-methyltransferase
MMTENTNPTPAWKESDSQTFIDYGRVMTPTRHEITEVFLDLAPARADESFLFADIGTGQGWLTEALLRHFPAARAIALDGSETMLRHAGATLAPFAGRFELRQFRLEDPAWPDSLPADARYIVSSLVLHHLDGPGKRELFGALHRRLAPGGALVIADVIAPTSESGRRHVSRAWEEVVRRQSLEYTGDLRTYELFVNDRWNIYEYPDPVDKPSSLPEQLRWLEQAGFSGVDVFWARAGHAVFGGYK